MGGKLLLSSASAGRKQIEMMVKIFLESGIVGGELMVAGLMALTASDECWILAAVELVRLLESQLLLFTQNTSDTLLSMSHKRRIIVVNDCRQSKS